MVTIGKKFVLEDLQWSDLLGTYIVVNTTSHMTLEEFFAHNQDTLTFQEMANIRSLRPGRAVIFGGDAAPVTQLRCLE